MKKHLITISSLFVAPFLVHAQPASNLESLMDFLLGLFTNSLIPLIISLGLIYLIVSVLGYMRADDDAQGRAEKKKQIFWSIIGLFVIISIWSLVAVVANTFNIFGGGVLEVK